MLTKTVLITGATGAVGPALAWHLHNKGYVVRVLARTTSAQGLLPPDVQFHAGDIIDPTAVMNAVQNVDIIFHLAALLHIENPPPSLIAEYRRVNVDATRLIGNSAAQAGVRRIVYFSTVKVYGIQQALPVTENQVARPDTPYAMTKLEGEWVIRSIEHLETVVLRLSPVYGPRLKGSWQRLTRAIARGLFLPIGTMHNRRSLTYVDDVAQAAHLVAEHEKTLGRIFNVVGHESPSIRDIFTAIYNSFGRKLPAFYIPTPLAKAGALTFEIGAKLVGKRSPITVDALRQLTEDEVYSGTALRSLGFSPSVTLAEGWKSVSEYESRIPTTH